MPEPAPTRHPAAIDHARDVCDTESGPSAPVVGAWVPRMHRSIAGLGSLSDATIERIARDLVRELVPPGDPHAQGLIWTYVQQAIRDLHGSINVEALPEMAARLVQHRVSGESLTSVVR